MEAPQDLQIHRSLLCLEKAGKKSLHRHLLWAVNPNSQVDPEEEWVFARLVFMGASRRAYSKQRWWEYWDIGA